MTKKIILVLVAFILLIGTFSVFSLEDITNQKNFNSALIDFENSQVSVCNFENTTANTEYGYLDTDNNYVISEYKPYSDVSPIYFNDKKGFDSSNFSIVTGGLNSNRCLKYSQKQNMCDIEYKSADISNGVVLEDNTSYALSFYYKAEGVSNKRLTFSFVNFRTNKQNCIIDSTVSINAADVKSEWTRVDLVLTTDFSYHDPDFHYSNQEFCIPAIVINKSIDDYKRTVYLDDFSISKIVSCGGVSVLKDKIAKDLGSQSLRFYFNYKADENGIVKVNGKELSITERGILLQNTKNRMPNSNEVKEYMLRENIGEYGIVAVTNINNLDKVWNYENGTVTFSTYITDFALDDLRNISARGYVVLCDGTVFYSEIIESVVNDIVKYNKYYNIKNTYNFTNQTLINSVKIQGDYDNTTRGITFDWTGSTVEFNAKCVDDVTVKLYIPHNATNQYYTVFVDGKRLAKRFVPKVFDEQNKIYTVTFNVGSEVKVHNIEFSRQAQASEGTSDLMAISINGTLDEPESENEILLEFIGDSITCGHGNIGSTGKAIDSDGTQAYAYLTAKALNVDWRIRSRSGIGFKYSNQGLQGISYTWADSYNYENPWRSNTVPYTIDKTADVVFIYLGTNDVSGYKIVYNEDYTTTTGKADFVSGMKNLINIVKRKNPKAKVVWIGGGMTSAYAEMAKTAVNELGGDSAGYYYCQLPNGMTHGGQGHPTAAQHKTISETLIEFLNNKNIIS